MNNYHLKLSDGKRTVAHDEKANSAAEAMGRSLAKNPTFKVVSCASGTLNPKEPHLFGEIHYEIPKHTAIREAPPVKKAAVVCGSFFNEEEIKAESSLARERFAK